MPAVRIEPRFVERVWGSVRLEPCFPNLRIGEVWFEAQPLLIKFLFTAEALSVQVHPNDAQARPHRGKTEMWYILHAEAGASIAAGFVKPVTREQVQDGALDGSIEEMLGSFQARPGDTFFMPAGCVHALGPGLVVCEIQQHSDITYRLYDYGRLPARELHLERGLEVARLEPHPGPEPVNGERLAACEYFVTERWALNTPRELDRPSVLIALEGAGRIDGQEFSRGEVWQTPKGASVQPHGEAVLLRTYEP